MVKLILIQKKETPFPGEFEPFRLRHRDTTGIRFPTIGCIFWNLFAIRVIKEEQEVIVSEISL